MQANVRARLRGLLERFAALSLRERMLVVIAMFAVAYQLTDLLVLERQYGQIGALNQAMTADNAALLAVGTEMRLLSSRAEQDPNRALRERLSTLQGQVRGLERRLETVTSAMISPRDMARFLEDLLNDDSELTLLSLRTLDTQPLLQADGKDDAETSPPPPAGERATVLHRHGFEVTFSGGYLATLRYLEALERLPWQFFWDGVSYEVVDYPQSVVRLQLHTLSLSEDWIGV